jgi:hypothetical protein
VNPRIQRVRAELANDLTTYSALVDELANLPPLAEGPRPIAAQAAVALHHAYGAVESALARIARLLDDSPPEGPDWHQALLTSMSLDIEGVRPAVLSGPALAALRRLLGFRHFFRHAYAVDLDGRRLEELRDVAVSSRAIVLSDLKRFDGTLAALADQ